MEISISAIPYQTLKKTHPEFCVSILEYFSSFPLGKLKSIIFLYDKDQIEEIKAFNNFFSIDINAQIGATPEQMHELLSLSPPMATLSNLQRKDNCLDLLLFKEQIQEILQNFPYPKEKFTVRIEADPEQVKAASKLGFAKVELDFAYPFLNEKDFHKFDEAIKVAQKISIKTAFGKGLKSNDLVEIFKKSKPDELIIDIPFYQISMKKGIDFAIDYFEKLKK